MTTSMLVSGKANASGSLKLSVLQCTRHYSSSSATLVNGKYAARIQDPATQRELFVNILNANATRRDAKQYLARFNSPSTSKSEPKDMYALLEERNDRHRRDQERLDRVGVNLGGLYAPARAIANSPQFALTHDVREQAKIVAQEEIHVALACLRSPEHIDDGTLDGLARTLSQLVKLDMKILLVLDSNGHYANNPDQVRAFRKLQAEQADRLCNAIDRHNPEGGRSVPNAIEVMEDHREVNITIPNLLEDPLKRGMIPIVPCLAYTAAGQAVPVEISDIMTGLTKHFVKISGFLNPQSLEVTSLDRIILIDSIGGIPSKDREYGAHVFINLEQEFDTIADELSEYSECRKDGTKPSASQLVYEQHRSNMIMLRRCLNLLPSASSALIVTPQEAASSSRQSESKLPALGAGTRRQRNPLIHNLLTNKPLVSSSLPKARLSKPDSDLHNVNAATVLRRGMPLQIIPAASRMTGWQPPRDGRTSLKLESDSRIDLPRLVHLIEDSFRRKLNVQNYLSRIEGRIAGVIVAGDYEGGAILTWEMPPGTDDPVRLVPYLDKFAVLQSSQGASGVADIVFQAMVRSCFPNGVCWRSRKDNPVNKWYFERSVGTWQIPHSNWTVFWTGDNIAEDEQKWNDYVGVCSNITASWGDDGKKPD